MGLVLRWEANGRKEIRPLALVEGGWVIGAMPAPRPIFRLELVASSAATNATVFVVEGEKAAAAGAKLKLATTTSAGGSAAARQTDWSPLAGRNVVILPDNDEPGRKYAHDVVGQLVALSPRPTIRVVRLPDLLAGGDLVDYIEQRSGQTNALIAKSWRSCAPSKRRSLRVPSWLERMTKHE